MVPLYLDILSVLPQYFFTSSFINVVLYPRYLTLFPDLLAISREIKELSWNTRPHVSFAVSENVRIFFSYFLLRKEVKIISCYY
jgi:hypothetical protein